MGLEDFSRECWHGHIDFVHHEVPSAAKPQPTVGISLAKTQRPQWSERKVENHWGEYLIFPLRTERLCALARGISESENFRLPEYLIGTL
jgi:hypothetical protein